MIEKKVKKRYLVGPLLDIHGTYGTWLTRQTKIDIADPLCFRANSPFLTILTSKLTNPIKETGS